MHKIPLYLYVYEKYSSIDPNRHSPNDIPYASQLIADEGKMLQKGNICALRVDTKNEDWNEIDISENIPIYETFVDVKFN